MSSQAIIDIDTIYGVSYLKIRGNLKLKQTSALDKGSIAHSLYNTEPFANNINPFDYLGQFNDYNRRNFTTYYDYTTIIQPYRASDNCVIDIEVSIPSYQEVLYYYKIDTTLLFLRKSKLHGFSI